MKREARSADVVESQSEIKVKVLAVERRIECVVIPVEIIARIQGECSCADALHQAGDENNRKEADCFHEKLKTQSSIVGVVSSAHVAHEVRVVNECPSGLCAGKT